MSEPREECYKCLNNSNCIPSADYGSVYCMLNRKFKMNTPELHKEWERKALKYDSLVEKIKEDKSNLEFSRDLDADKGFGEDEEDMAVRRYIETLQELLEEK